MALRDIFKFRELPESETSKPFLEHLEDLRWTIVKMAITLLVAMIFCFAIRSSHRGLTFPALNSSHVHSANAISGFYGLLLTAPRLPTRRTLALSALTHGRAAFDLC